MRLFRDLVNQDPTIKVLLILSFLLALSVCIQLPLFSLFMTSHVGVNAFWAGIFFMAYAVIGIVCSLWLANWSDKLSCRKKLMEWCCVSGVAGGIFFAFCRDFVVLLIIGNFLLGLSCVVTPQIFAFAKEHTQSNHQRFDVVSTLMRASYSLAWVVGPPVSFWVAETYGFEIIFCFVSFIFACIYRYIIFYLPANSKKKQARLHMNWQLLKQSNLYWLFITTTFMWICNSAYLFCLPLFTVHHLNIDVSWGGMFLGSASLLELPIMFYIGFLLTRSRVSKPVLMLLAVTCGIGFFLGLLWVDTVTDMLVVQLLNAIFIGILAGIGKSYFLDLLPESFGVAATLFVISARIGAVAGGVIAGLIAQFFDFEMVFSLLVLLMLCALLAYLPVYFQHHKTQA